MAYVVCGVGTGRVGGVNRMGRVWGRNRTGGGCEWHGSGQGSGCAVSCAAMPELTRPHAACHTASH
eukprot:282179-Chlamydomonas_euryale.AAC.1